MRGQRAIIEADRDQLQNKVETLQNNTANLSNRVTLLGQELDGAKLDVSTLEDNLRERDVKESCECELSPTSPVSSTSQSPDPARVHAAGSELGAPATAPSGRLARSRSQHLRKGSAEARGATQAGMSRCPWPFESQYKTRLWSTK